MPRLRNDELLNLGIMMVGLGEDWLLVKIELQDEMPTRGN